MKDLKIKLLSGKILVKPNPVEDKTSGGIILVQSAQERPQEGTVIVVGKSAPEEPMEVSVGDVVVYQKHAGTDITIENEKYLMMRQTDILFIK